MSYLPHPKSKVTPSRRSRKAERNRVFIINRTAKKKQRTERRRANHA